MKRLVIAVVLLVACAVAAWTFLHAWYIVPAKAAVAMHFKDPFAVEFEGVGLRMKDGIAVCGRFNAKDSAGAIAAV